MDRQVANAMEVYEKRQGRELDEIERHVFRSAYAMGVLDQQSDHGIAVGRLRDKAKRLEDALRGMLEAHLLEDYSRSGHYIDLCGKAWEKARDVIGEECDGVVTPNV